MALKDESIDQKPEEPLQPQCHICHKLFSRPDSLSRHILRHSDNRPYACATCPSSFHLRHDLKRHECNHNPNPTPHVCDTCGKLYRSQGALYNHRQIHATTGYMCETCGASYQTKFSYKRHVNNAHGPKAPCPACGKRFVSLDDHVQVCGQRKREARYSCEICHSRFLENRYLKEHVKYKHGTPRYNCTKCGAWFSHRRVCVSHKKKCHVGDGNAEL